MLLTLLLLVRVRFLRLFAETTMDCPALELLELACVCVCACAWEGELILSVVITRANLKIFDKRVRDIPELRFECELGLSSSCIISCYSTTSNLCSLCRICKMSICTSVTAWWLVFIWSTWWFYVIKMFVKSFWIKPKYKYCF